MIVVNKAEVERRMVEKDLKVYHLRKISGMTALTYKNTINNVNDTKLSVIEKLCDALECQPSDILMKVKDA